MNLLGKIIFIYVMHCAVATSPPKMPIDNMGTDWNQSLSTSMKFLSKVNTDELFYDLLPGENNNSLAILEWINPIADRPTGFNLTTITHSFSGMSMGIQPCSFPAEEDIEFLTPVKVTYLRSDRVLVYFRKTHKTKGSIQIPQIIDTESCKLEEGINVEPQVKFAAVSIVPFKNTFDVVFENQALCPQDSWCRMTFDHDGKKISEPTSLFVEKHNLKVIDKIYPMNYETNKNGFVVVVKKSGVYSPIRGLVPIDELKASNHFYSNTSGYASVCWQTENLINIKCTWLDGTHKHKKGADSIMTVSLNGRVKKMPYTHNTPKGKIAILQEGRDNDQKVIFSDTATSDGKCKRYMKTPFSNELKKVQMVIINGEKSCVSLVSRNPDPISENSYSTSYAYKFETKCEEFPKDFKSEKIDCGKNYAA